MNYLVDYSHGPTLNMSLLTENRGWNFSPRDLRKAKLQCGMDLDWPRCNKRKFLKQNVQEDFYFGSSFLM